jgi:undecaprenyl diphosphate synthase
MRNYPLHIAVIPDGNRRWAKLRKKPAVYGHQQGAKATEKILKKALELKIPYLTIWALSVNNILKRDKGELKGLYKILQIYFQRLSKDKEIHKNKVKVRVLGKWNELLPESVKKTIKEAVKKTKNYSDYYNLTFLLAYSGIEEMTEAVKKIAKVKIQCPKIRITKQLIKENLLTKELPPVDLIIRTGGEPHLSEGFMMWDAAYSQLYFTETLYPDFTPEEFEKAVMSYSKRERRFGK